MDKEMQRRGFLRLAATTAVGGALPWMSMAKAAYAKPTSAAELDPDAALKELLAGNARYVARDAQIPVTSPVREDLSWGQTPRAIILSCSDSRVPPEIIFDQYRGELFIVRVAGNFVNDDGLASMEYATAVLGTRLVVVLGHSQCGAVDATINYVKEGTPLPGHLPELIDAIKPAVEEVKGQPGNMLANAIAANAKLNAQKLASSTPLISKAVEKGQVKVVAGVYDLKSGKVDIFG
ncbi:MAG: carbonic anhydrase [Myxococcota bacterium]|nr:carbonic anhydrase [Myxococcota bacterium]